MAIILITGSSGLIGSETAKFFNSKGFEVIGIDNDMRKYFFGEEASTLINRNYMKKYIDKYTHYDIDIRDFNNLEKIFERYGSNISVIVHTAAQPSHDWAAKEPFTDFGINAAGTLNLLELTKKYCPDAPFVFTSTNKVYGDTPNKLPLIEKETRWEIEDNNKFYNNGINETMSIDQSVHSLFGASKVSADLLVQEYGKYFGLKTVCFRGGCLTGPLHCGTKLHGFLSYLVKCAILGDQYTIFGYKGKQVRDNIHSYDLVNAFWHFYQNPRCGEVYNIGGSRFSNCSVIEAINVTEETLNKEMKWTYIDENRIGDHIWWISDISKFKNHYPEWNLTKNVRTIIEEITESLEERKELYAK